MAHKVRVQQYRGPRDLLERLVRDLRALQQATTAAAALDCAITYCCTAWGLTNWLFMPVARDASLRRELARAADRGMASIDATINLDGYEAWRVCPQFATGIAAIDRYGTPPNWRSSGRPVYICDMTSADKLLTPMYGPAVRGQEVWGRTSRSTFRSVIAPDCMLRRRQHRVAHDVAVALGGARLGDVNSPES